MALPHLIKYVYTHGTDEVIRRGKKIHAIGYVELVEYDDLFGSAVFRVKDDSYATYYKVYIQKFKDPQSTSLRCGCPYNLGDICRHEAATLFQLLGGLLVLLGIKEKLGATLLILFLIPVTVLMHSFWMVEGAERQPMAFAELCARLAAMRKRLHQRAPLTGVPPSMHLASHRC